MLYYNWSTTKTLPGSSRRDAEGKPSAFCPHHAPRKSICARAWRKRTIPNSRSATTSRRRRHGGHTWYARNFEFILHICIDLTFKQPSLEMEMSFPVATPSSDTPSLLPPHPQHQQRWQGALVQKVCSRFVFVIHTNLHGRCSQTDISTYSMCTVASMCNIIGLFFLTEANCSKLFWIWWNCWICTGNWRHAYGFSIALVACVDSDVCSNGVIYMCYRGLLKFGCMLLKSTESWLCATRAINLGTTLWGYVSYWDYIVLPNHVFFSWCRSKICLHIASGPLQSAWHVRVLWCIAQDPALGSPSKMITLGCK